MASQQSAQEPEILLDRWVREHDAVRARLLLENLVSHHAEPVVRRIVQYKLQSASASRDGAARHADIDDVTGTALYSLLARLDRIKSGDGEPPLRNFTGYAATVAYNACNEYFRARMPAWVRLSMKLRYLAAHASKFAVWELEDSREAFGLARDRARPAATDLVALRERCLGFRLDQNHGRLSLGELVEAVLSQARAPLIFEDLVDIVAECSGLQEARVQSLDQNRRESEPGWEPADVQPPAEARLGDRQYIAYLWKEICSLPLEHRKALLFNLQDSAGGDIQLFDFLGIATISQIAAAVEMEPLVFAELWKRLPLDDGWIAQHLGLSRQDVANRRSSARKRLARKMKEFECANLICRRK